MSTLTLRTWNPPSANQSAFFPQARDSRACEKIRQHLRPHNTTYERVHRVLITQIPQKSMEGKDCEGIIHKRCPRSQRHLRGPILIDGFSTLPILMHGTLNKHSRSL
jgi:hypothetical protein